METRDEVVSTQGCGDAKVILVSVLQEDIDNVRHHPGPKTVCPIQIALERITGSAWGVGTLTVVGRGYRGALPPEARAFVRSYDWGDPVEPFSFLLRVSC